VWKYWERPPKLQKKCNVLKKLFALPPPQLHRDRRRRRRRRQSATLLALQPLTATIILRTLLITVANV
jgi:hypothetical protein